MQGKSLYSLVPSLSITHVCVYIYIYTVYEVKTSLEKILDKIS